MTKIKEWFKRVFSKAYLASFLGLFIGTIANMLIVLGMYGLGKLMEANQTSSIAIGSIFAYPIASIISKYARLGFRKILKVK